MDFYAKKGEGDGTAVLSEVLRCSELNLFYPYNLSIIPVLPVKVACLPFVAKTVSREIANSNLHRFGFILEAPTSLTL